MKRSIAQCVSNINLVVLLYALAGCGSKSNIALSGAVRNPDVQSMQSSLGAELGGGFDLFLEVGAQASGSSEVTLEQVALLDADADADDGGVLVEPLDAASSEPFPIEVDAGSSRTIAFMISSSNFLDEATNAALCDGNVAVRVVVTDSLLDGQTVTLTSTELAPSCQ